MCVQVKIASVTCLGSYQGQLRLTGSDGWGHNRKNTRRKFQGQNLRALLSWNHPSGSLKAPESLPTHFQLRKKNWTWSPRIVSQQFQPKGSQLIPGFCPYLQFYFIIFSNWYVLFHDFIYFGPWDITYFSTQFYFL